jgi:glutamate 5-kinase
MQSGEILLLKFGRESLMGEMSRLSAEIFANIARQVAVLMLQGIKVAIVSSGAIQAGKERMTDIGQDAAPIPEKILSGIGTRHLLNFWGSAFSNFGHEIAPFWLTYANLTAEDGTILTNIEECFARNIVPIINENDIVSDEEIKAMNLGVSENDHLAVLLGRIIRPSALILITKSGAVFTGNPVTDPYAIQYLEIDRDDIPFNLLADCQTTGKGGMNKKILQAVNAANEGFLTVIAGPDDNTILRFARGEEVGTLIGHQNKL